MGHQSSAAPAGTGRCPPAGLVAARSGQARQLWGPIGSVARQYDEWLADLATAYPGDRSGMMVITQSELEAPMVSWWVLAVRPAAEYPARHIPGVASTPVRRARDPPRRTAPGQPGGPLLPPSSDADQAVDRAAADGRTAARLADRFPERAAARLRAGNGRVVSTTPPAGPPLLTPVSPGRGARQVLQAAAGRWPCTTRWREWGHGVLVLIFGTVAVYIIRRH